MPMYDYLCEACGPEVEYQGIHDEPLTKCPKCGSSGYQKQISRPHSLQQEYRRPIEMHSIAYIDDRDIKAFAKAHPDVKMSLDKRDPLYGVPVARSRHEKKKLLKIAGFEERN